MYSVPLFFVYASKHMLSLKLFIRRDVARCAIALIIYVKRVPRRVKRLTL